MPNFLFVYHGGGKMPTDPKEIEKEMAAWGAWFEQIGESNIVDGGNPVGQSFTVSDDGSVVENGGSNPVSGYSIFRADSMQDAIALAKKGPQNKAGGTTEIAEIIEL